MRVDTGKLYYSESACYYLLKRLHDITLALVLFTLHCIVAVFHMAFHWLRWFESACLVYNRAQHGPYSVYIVHGICLFSRY